MRYLYGLAPDHPSHRYLLLETADECRHSAMFGEYVGRARFNCLCYGDVAVVLKSAGDTTLLVLGMNHEESVRWNGWSGELGYRLLGRAYGVLRVWSGVGSGSAGRLRPPRSRLGVADWDIQTDRGPLGTGARPCAASGVTPWTQTRTSGPRVLGRNRQIAGDHSRRAAGEATGSVQGGADRTRPAQHTAAEHAVVRLGGGWRRRFPRNSKRPDLWPARRSWRSGRAGHGEVLRAHEPACYGCFVEGVGFDTGLVGGRSRAVGGDAVARWFVGGVTVPRAPRRSEMVK